MIRSLAPGLGLALLMGFVLGCGRQEQPKVAQNTDSTTVVTPQQPPNPDPQAGDSRKTEGAPAPHVLATREPGDHVSSTVVPGLPPMGMLPMGGTGTGSVPMGQGFGGVPGGPPAGVGGVGGIGGIGGGGTAPGGIGGIGGGIGGVPGGIAAGPIPGAGGPPVNFGAMPKGKGGAKGGFGGGGLPGGGLAPGRPGPGAPRADGAGKADPAQARPGDDNAQNVEQYGNYRENEFRSPLVAALSTFSADVNTASYSNVRRMLTGGTLPPRDAVFVAEFVNYFPYNYAQPKGDDPIAFNLEMGPCPWNRKHHLVRVGVQAYKIDPEKMPPRNLVFLIDTSGSMSAPNRLPLVKQALALLVDQLTDKDFVSVVTYAGDSRVALGPTNGKNKDRIKEVITTLQAQGGTNGEGGIKTAYKLAKDTFIDGGVNRVILCTDGDFNIGQTNDGELVKMIEDERRSKVFLTTLGFGMGNYKDERLKSLANHGNGHHAYIDTLDEAKKLFVEQGGALVCVAKDVKFQVDFNPAKVAAYRLIGYENRLLKDEDFRNDAKDAGDMGSGHQVTVLYEIIPMGVSVDLPGVEKSKYVTPSKPDPNAPDEWLTVKMRYKHPEEDKSKELSQPLPGKALGQELSDDFRFASAAAAFAMMLRQSEYRGGMTYAGVIEEAQGCLKTDPGGHRKEFVELAKKAKSLAQPVKIEAPGGGDN